MDFSVFTSLKSIDKALGLTISSVGEGFVASAMGRVKLNMSWRSSMRQKGLNPRKVLLLFSVIGEFLL